MPNKKKKALKDKLPTKQAHLKLWVREIPELDSNRI